MDNLTQEELDRYRRKALDSNAALETHMKSAPDAAHSRDSNDRWQVWIVTAKRLGNVAMDTRIAFIRAKRQFEAQEQNKQW